MPKYTGIDELDDVLGKMEAAGSRDKHDSCSDELAKIAPKYIPEIDVLFDSGTYYRMPLIWCLIGCSDPKAIDLFQKALADRDQYTRWAAVEALAMCGGSIPSRLLVAALKDRSHMVKGTAVRAMVKFRDADAVPQLKKIIASKHLNQAAPGIVESAKTALGLCQSADNHG